MRHFIVRLLHPLLRRYYSWWSRKSRYYRSHGLDMIVLPGVFHPGIFISTRLMMEHVAMLPLEGRGFLELGAGTGAVALVAASRGAVVTATDISTQAVRNLELNSVRNKLPITIVRSDLFDSIPGHFDVIAINPPYYPYEPRTEAEQAFFAGTDRQYFVRLFPELARRVAEGSEVYMVLSDDLDHHPINQLAADKGLQLIPSRRKVWFGEAQVVYHVVGR